MGNICSNQTSNYDVSDPNNGVLNLKFKGKTATKRPMNNMDVSN